MSLQKPRALTSQPLASSPGRLWKVVRGPGAEAALWGRDAAYGRVARKGCNPAATESRRWWESDLLLVQT